MTYRQELEKTARALVADHKGILAADESTGTITQRFGEAGLVPIISPEVPLDDERGLEKCAEVMETTLTITIAARSVRGPRRSAHQTHVTCLLRAVPVVVPGVSFLSGGQEAIAAPAHFNTMNSIYSDAPWALSFSFARALQEPAMATWRGDNALEYGTVA